MEVTTIGLLPPQTPKHQPLQSSSSVGLSGGNLSLPGSALLSASTTNRLAQVLKRHHGGAGSTFYGHQTNNNTRSSSFFAPTAFAMTVKRYRNNSNRPQQPQGINTSQTNKDCEQMGLKEEDKILTGEIQTGSFENTGNHQAPGMRTMKEVMTNQYQSSTFGQGEMQQIMTGTAILGGGSALNNQLVPRLATRANLPGRSYKSRRMQSRDIEGDEDSGNDSRQRGTLLSRDGSPSVMEKINQPLQLKNQQILSISMSQNPSSLGLAGSSMMPLKQDCQLFTSGGPPPLLLQQTQPRKDFIINNQSTKIRVRSSSIQQQTMLQQRRLQNKLIEKQLLSQQSNTSQALQASQLVTSTSDYKQPCIASLRGPILLSAPHSSKLLRGGYHSQTKERIHLREQYVSTIILSLAYMIEKIQRERVAEKVKQNPKDKTTQGHHIHKVSLLFWNKDKKFDKFTLDPNYLVRAQFKDSPFHQALHRFIETQAGIDFSKDKQSNRIIQAFTPLQATTPLFHLDIHGKKDRKHNMDIDLGTRAMREDFKLEDQETLVESIIKGFVVKMTEIFENVEIKNMKVVCNPQGELVGKWGTGNMHTMTHQSVLLGIPAMQLEFPRSLRHLFIREPRYIEQLARCILSTYEDIIVPQWQNKKTDILINYSMTKQLAETKLNHEKLKELSEEYEQWDKKGDEQLI